MLLSVSCIGISGVLKAFVTNKIIFGFLRILHGIGGQGCALVSYVISAESSLPKYKVSLMFIPGIGFQIGELMYAIEAYFLRDWVPLQLASHIPILFMILFYFVVPESCRWLISQGRISEVKQILMKRAQVNHSEEIPEHIFERNEANSVIGSRLSFGQSFLAISKCSSRYLLKNIL